MIRRFVTVALVAALAAPAAALAQGREIAAKAPTEGVDAPKSVSAEVERLRVEGFTDLFSLDYKAAGKVFDQIVEIAPDRPQGYLYRATNIWFKSLFDNRLLSTSLYSQDAFYAQKEKTVDPAVDKAFRENLQKAITVAETRLKTDPNDVEALYYLGAAHGALGGYEASMARAFMSALKHGSKSVDLHEKVLKIDPEFTDAYLTVGMYHYVVGSLPFAVKLLAAVGGVRGSKKDGLNELERAAKTGRRVSDDAKVLLVSLYARENRLADSLELLGQLETKYPANYVIQIEEASTLVRLKRYDEAFARFDKLLETPRVKSEAKDYVSYAYGDALKEAGKHERALQIYANVWTWQGADPDLVTLARLGAGECHDALGQRSQALTQYKMVLRRADVLDSRKRAERYVKKPYSPSAPMASTGQLSSAS